MSNVKDALTRKLGPLPAWAWIGLFAIGVWYYRRKMGGVVSGTGTGSVAPAPQDPQGQVTLQPGESVYDPNTGGFLTAPGGSGDTTGNGSDMNQGLEDLATAINSAISNGSNSDSGNGVTTKQSPHGKPNRHRNHKRKPKSKHGQTEGKGKHQKRARSKGTIRNKLGGRGGRILGGSKMGSRKYGRSHSLHPSAAAGPHGGARQRPTTPARQRVVRQRPEAATKPSHQSEPTPNHRPSAPPPRKHRHRRHH